MNSTTVFLRVLGHILPGAFGFDYRAIGKLHKKEGFSSDPIRCANGFAMAGATSNAAYVSGINERPYMKHLAHSLTNGDVIYNIGANIGYMSLWLSQHFANLGERVSCVAFEPDEENYDLLRGNLLLNASLEISPENLALGNFDGSVGFSSNGGGDGSAHVDPSVARKVEICKLDTFQGTQDRSPNWLIIDIEGYGGECLDGARAVLNKHRPNVAMEIHSTEERYKSRLVLCECEYILSKSMKSLWGEFEIWRPK